MNRLQKARDIRSRRGWVQFATRIRRDLWIAAKLEAIAEDTTLEEFMTETLEEHLARSVAVQEKTP